MEIQIFMDEKWVIKFAWSNIYNSAVAYWNVHNNDKLNDKKVTQPVILACLWPASGYVVKIGKATISVSHPGYTSYFVQEDGKIHNLACYTYTYVQNYTLCIR